MAPVEGFTMTSFNGQLVLVGGEGDDDRITVWDSANSKWIHPYPPMPTGRARSAAVGYQHYLIVACGGREKNVVEVLDSSNGRWYTGPPMPSGNCLMTSALISECWYVSSYDEYRVFWTHLPSLISSSVATDLPVDVKEIGEVGYKEETPIWKELPIPPVYDPTLLAFQEYLLLVGGSGRVKEIYCFDKEVGCHWRVCGQLPVGISGPCCAFLPSGDLMVAGGETTNHHTLEYSKRMWVSNIQVKI